MQTIGPKLVAVVIPALHRPDLTKRCIASLQKQTVPADQFETIVVENEAQPSTVLPHPLPPHVRRIDLPENLGTTGSINRGIDESSSKYVLLLNNDVELEPDFLANLVSVLERNEHCGFATGKLLNASARNRLDGAGDALLLGGAACRLGHSDLDAGQFDQPRPILSGCGAATLFRRSALSEAGGLDPDFFAYLDDMDLALRSQLLGWGGIYVPDAVACHVGSATLQDSFHPKIVEWMTRNQVWLVVKNYPAGVLLGVSFRIVVFQMLWLGIVLRHLRFPAYVKGLIGAICLFPGMLRKRRQIMRRRKIANADFIGLLHASEKQIFEWEHTRPAGSRSTLLRIYFSLFGRP